MTRRFPVPFVLAVLAASSICLCSCERQPQPDGAPVARQPSRDAFADRLVGSWESEDFTFDEPPAKLAFRVDFAADQTYVLTVAPTDGQALTYTGTWQVQNDSSIKSQETTRFIVLSGEPEVQGRHETIFGRSKLLTTLLAKEVNGRREWRRASQ